MNIKTVKSSQKQDQVQVYGNKTNVYLCERELTREQDGDTQIEYEYSVVSLSDRYAGDVVQIAKDFFKNSLVLTPRKARLALLSIGKLADVETAINAMEDPDKSMAQVEWEYSAEIKRTHPFVELLGTALELSDDEIDMLFVTGASL